MIRRAYHDLAHGQMHVRVHETPGAPWLVLLHQSPSSSAMFEPLMHALAGRFSLLAPDNPGFGQSDPLPHTSVPALAEAVGAVMDARGIARAGLFGHHTGAAIAGELAARRPDLCAGLAMCGPPILDAAMRAKLPGMAPVEPLRADGGHLTRMWARLRAKETAAPVAISQRELGLAFAAAAVTADAYRAVADHDLAACLTALSCPKLVFAGVRDSLVDHLPRAGAIAGVAPIVMEDAGGYACEMATDRVAALLDDFFTEAFKTSECA